jgi:hypothetical protein
MTDPAKARPSEDPKLLGTEDMHDTPGDLNAADPILRFALEECREVERVYAAADYDAGNHQKSYQIKAKIAAYLGVTAVLLAIATLALERAAEIQWVEKLILILTLVESASALAVGFVVLRGRTDDNKENWLVGRHRAERCRLLKFRFLTHPLLWTGREPDRRRWKGGLDAELHEIDTLTFEELKVWLGEDMPPEVRAPSLPRWPDEKARTAFVDYYRRKRLNNQRDYFARKAKQHSASDRSTKPWPPWLFYGSVTAVLIHLLLDGINFYLRGQGEPKAGDLVRIWSAVFVYLAAALPTIGAGVRTYRTAHEFARNTSRFQAKHHALCELERRLSEVLNEVPSATRAAAQSPLHDADAVLRELGFCEHVLESDHREWLRLMVEAEWFG